MRSPAGGESIVLHETGMSFVAPANTAVDIVFNGCRVWSVSTADLESDENGRFVVDWPDKLRPRLDGRATVEVRTHGSEVAVAARPVQFGTSESPIQLTNRYGRPLVLDKWGRLKEPFDVASRDSVDEYLDAVQRIIDVISGECGLPAFLSFGSLLGAVRDGRLIGHDVDVDIGYFSAAHFPVDTIRESFVVESVLRGRSWRVVRQSGAFLQVYVPLRDGPTRNVDIFTCFHDGADHVFQEHDITMPGDDAAVVPLGEAMLEGRVFPAPRDTERFLEAAYGPDWRTPNPAFSYRKTAAKRRLRGWYGGLSDERNRWRDVYGGASPIGSDKVSPFAQWVLAQSSAETIVDLGCGRGADSTAYAEAGRAVVAVDAVPALVRKNARRARRHGVDVQFVVTNLASIRESLLLGAVLSRRTDTRAVVARHLLDELTPGSRENFWRVCDMALRGGGRCFLEFTPGMGRGPTRPFSDRDPHPLTAEDVERAVEGRARVTDTLVSDTGTWWMAVEYA